MAIGFRASIELLATLIEGATPVTETDVHFRRYASDAMGDVADVELLMTHQEQRAFQIRAPGLGADAGEAGTPGKLLRSILSIDVAYPGYIQGTARMVKMTEDLGVIMEATQQCSLWDTVNTGINTIDVTTSQPTQQTVVINGTNAGVLLSIPVTLIYRRA